MLLSRRLSSMAPRNGLTRAAAMGKRAVASTAPPPAAAEQNASSSEAAEATGPSQSRAKRPRYVPAPLVLSSPPLSSPSRMAKEELVDSSGPSTPSPARYSLRQRRQISRAAGASQQQAAPLASQEQDVKVKREPSTEPLAVASTPSRRKPGAPKQDPFASSSRKTTAKPIKVELDASEARPAPKRWQEQYEVLAKQRRRIVAPVDTMGCQENGKDDRRQDARQTSESAEDVARRERFTILVSLMLSSQTKDPVTAEAVYNLQRNLPGGLCLQSILDASQDDISRNINKVGFWRRKTGYIQSASRILQDDFEGDVPKTIDELCSLPGVGPKMGFLALQGAWNLNMGIGVDVHVHRVANRLNWVKSTDPEGTRLQLQSWLPKEMHRTINKTLVGFGQVICQPVGPRCDLCALGSARLCPSYRRVDPKAAASRVKVELLPDSDDENDGKERKDSYSNGGSSKANTANGAVSATAAVAAVASAADGSSEDKSAIALSGPEGAGVLLVKSEDVDDEPAAHLEW